MSVPPPSYKSFPDDPVLGSVYAPTNKTPPSLLQRQFAQSITADVETRLLHAERRLKWIVPVSVAIGFTCGIFLALLVISHMPVIPHVETTAALMIKAPDKNVKQQHDPQLWIAYISELLLDNKVELAQRELNAFREKFPEYSK